MVDIREMLLANKRKLNQEKALKHPTERVCLCGKVVKIEDMSPSQQRYKKFRCIECENERKSKYRRKKGTEAEVTPEEVTTKVTTQPTTE